MGRSTSYTLRYDHSDDGSRLDWELLRGDIMRRLDGSYVLTPVTGDGDRTLVTYHLDVELVVSLPGFVKRRRSEEHTSELQSLMRISYAAFCMKHTKNSSTPQHPPC